MVYHGLRYLRTIGEKLGENRGRNTLVPKQEKSPVLLTAVAVIKCNLYPENLDSDCHVYYTEQEMKSKLVWLKVIYFMPTLYN